jgi:hypothetical protein
MLHCEIDIQDLPVRCRLLKTKRLTTWMAASQSTYSVRLTRRTAVTRALGAGWLAGVPRTSDRAVGDRTRDIQCRAECLITNAKRIAIVETVEHAIESSMAQVSKTSRKSLT